MPATAWRPTVAELLTGRKASHRDTDSRAEPRTESRSGNPHAEARTRTESRSGDPHAEAHTRADNRAHASPRSRG
ncbi:hypothetical protein GCM10010430_19640 [Kitasatospora cystarginea]|uniref:Uncharacterized protein n=1 Tax=Kitasatospora cystarginea TaxID=58350 RepID=A0ABN3DQD2_9ACTN